MALFHLWLQLSWGKGWTEFCKHDKRKLKHYKTFSKSILSETNSLMRGLTRYMNLGNWMISFRLCRQEKELQHKNYLSAMANFLPICFRQTTKVGHCFRFLDPYTRHAHIDALLKYARQIKTQIHAQNTHSGVCPHGRWAELSLDVKEKKNTQMPRQNGGFLHISFFESAIHQKPNWNYSVRFAVTSHRRRKWNLIQNSGE